MSYPYLSEHLQPTADAVKQFFKDSRGISHFKIEEAFDADLGYRPTLHVQTKDHYILCVDVHETPYSSVLDSVVLDCVRRALPVKLYVAFPEGKAQTEYKKNVDRARQNGVGVLEVKATGIQVIHEALALSLAGVREIPTKSFPAKYRATLAHAETTFRSGSPVEGSLVIYTEVEALSRKLAKKTQKKGMWRALKGTEKVPKLSDKTAWQKVIETEIDFIDREKCPSITKPLLGRILSVAPHRNSTGHKPKNRKELITRDKELKTRFESAVDLLKELIDAGKPLGL
jgi:hypothetical protein